MKIAAALVVALASFGRPSPAPAGHDASREAAVVAAERAWSEAFLRHDLAALSRILADDFIGIDGRGIVSDKTAELEEAKAAGPGAALALVAEQLSDVRVRFYGETGILTAVNTARFSSADGESTVRYRRTTVWVPRDGRWQCVSFHGSRIQAPPG